MQGIAFILSLQWLMSTASARFLVPLVTVTAHRSCPTTASPTLPAYGWISTNGSVIPYTFTTNDVTTGLEGASTPSLTRSGEHTEQPKLPITEITITANSRTFTAADYVGSVVLQDGSSRATLKDGMQTIFAGQTVSALANGDGVVLLGSNTYAFGSSSTRLIPANGQILTAVDYQGSMILINGTSTITLQDASATTQGGKVISALDSGDGVVVGDAITSLFNPGSGQTSQMTLGTGSNAITAVATNGSVVLEAGYSTITLGEGLQMTIASQTISVLPGGNGVVIDGSTTSTFGAQSTIPQAGASLTPATPSATAGTENGGNTQQTSASSLGGLVPDVSPSTSTDDTTVTVISQTVPDEQSLTSSSVDSTATSGTTPISDEELPCPVPGASYGYTDPESGSQYAVQCNTTHGGSVYQVLVEPNIGACLDACNDDPRCDAVGYDLEKDLCYQYNALAAGSGYFSPTMHFAQLRSRAVVTNGYTSLVPVSISMYSQIGLPTSYPTNGAPTLSPSPVTSVRGGTTTLSTYTTLSASSALVRTSTVVNGGETSVSTAYATITALSLPSESIATALSVPPSFLNSAATAVGPITYGSPISTITTVLGGQTLVSTYATVSGSSSFIATSTSVLGGQTLTITAYATPSSGFGQVSASQTGLAASIVPGVVTLVANPTDTAPLGIGGQIASPIASGAYLLPNGATLIPGGPAATIDGTTYTLAPSANATPAISTLTAPSDPSLPITIGTQVASPIASGAYLLPGGSTLFPGGPAAILDGITYTLAQVASPGPGIVTLTASPGQSAPITIGTQIATPNSSGAFVLPDGQTLSPGSSAVTLNGLTYTLAPATPAAVTHTAGPGQNGPITIGTQTATPNASGAFVLPDGQTLLPGGSAVTIGNIAYTLAPGFSVNFPITIGAQVASPVASGAYVLPGGQTLSPGGPGVTVGNIVYTLPPATTPAGPDIATLTVGGNGFSPILIGSQSITPIASGVYVLPGGQTLSPGGSAVPLDGTIYTLAPAPTRAPGAFTLTQGVASSPIFVGGQTALPAGSGTYVLPDGQSIYVGGPAVVLNSATYTLGPLSNSSPANVVTISPGSGSGAPITINGQAVSPAASGQYVLPGGQTLSPGGSAVAFNSILYTLPALASPTQTQPAQTSLGIVTAIPGASQGSVLGLLLPGSTIGPGSSAVYSGTTYSLPTSGSGLYANGQAVVLPTTAPGSPITLPNSVVLTSTTVSDQGSPSEEPRVIFPGVTLLPGSATVISSTAYSLPTSGNSIYVNGAAYAPPTAVPGSPITLPNSVVAMPTSVPNVVLGTQTLLPGGTPVTAVGTIYSLSGSSIVVAGPSTTFNIALTGQAPTITQAPATSSAGGASLDTNSPPALTIHGTTYTAEPSPNGLPASYLINGQALTPGGTIATTNPAGALETISLDPAGSTVAFIAESSTTLSQIASPVLQTTAPVLTIDGSTFSAVSYVPGSQPTYIVNGQTLTAGGVVTTLDPSGAVETLSLDPAGTAVAFIAQSTTSISRIPASAAARPTATPILTVNDETFAPISYTVGSPPTYVIGSQTLTPGGAITTTNQAGAPETLSLDPVGTAVVFIAQSTTSTSRIADITPTSVSTSSSVPVLTIGGETFTAVSYSQGEQPTFVINGQTLTPGGQISTSLSNGATAVLLGFAGSSLAFVAPSTTSLSQLGPLATISPDPSFPLLTINGDVYTAASNVDGGLPTYIINGQTLTPGGSIFTVLSEDVTAISLDSAGTGLAFIGQSTTSTSQVVPSTSAATLPPVLTVNGDTFTAISYTQGGQPTYLIGDQTLTPGGVITTSLSGGATAVSLDPAGTALALIGDNSIVTSQIKTPAAASETQTSSSAPVLTINGESFTAISYTPGSQPTYSVNGQILTPGSQVSLTLPGGITAISLDASSSALQFLGQGTVLTSQIATPPPTSYGTSQSDTPMLTFNGDTYTVTVFSDDTGVAYVIDGQTLMPGGIITLAGSNGVNTVSFNDAGPSLIAVNSGNTTTVPAPGANVATQASATVDTISAAPAQTVGSPSTVQPTDSQEQPTLSPGLSVATPSATSSGTSASVSPGVSPYVTSTMSSRRTRTASGASGLVTASEGLTTFMSGGTTVATTIGGSTMTMSMSTRVMVTTPRSVITMVQDDLTTVSTWTGSAFSTTRDATVRTMVMGGVRTSFVSGGTTVVAPSTLVASSSASSATPEVAEQRIGLCPEYNGLLYSAEEDSGSALVTCGNIYEGQVAANDTQVDAQGCDYTCVDMEDCMAFSYTQNGCNLYSDVSGMRISEVPVFSALRLRTVQKAADTTTLSAMPSTTALAGSSTSSGGFVSSLASLFSSAFSGSSTDLVSTTISSSIDSTVSSTPLDLSSTANQHSSSGLLGTATLTDLGNDATSLTGSPTISTSVQSVDSSESGLTGEGTAWSTIPEGSTFVYTSGGMTLMSVAQSELVVPATETEPVVSQQATISAAPTAEPSTFVITYITGGSTSTYASAGQTYTSVDGGIIVTTSGFGVAPTQLPCQSSCLTASGTQETPGPGVTQPFTATYVTGGSTTIFTSDGQLYTSVDGGTLVETVANGPTLSGLPCQSGCLLPFTAVPGVMPTLEVSSTQDITSETIASESGSYTASETTTNSTLSPSASIPELAASTISNLSLSPSSTSTTSASVTWPEPISTVWGFQISYAWPSMIVASGSTFATSTPGLPNNVDMTSPTLTSDILSTVAPSNVEIDPGLSTGTDPTSVILATPSSTSPTAAPSPMCQADAAAGQALQNSDFCMDDMSAWSSGVSSEDDPTGSTSSSSTSSGRATVAVISRRAVISYARSATQDPTSAWIGQSISTADGEAYNVTADLWVTMPEDSSSVSVAMLQLGNTTIFSTGNITASQNYTVNVAGAVSSDMTAFRLISAYSGEQAGAVALDNVYVSLGPNDASVANGAGSMIIATTVSSLDVSASVSPESTLTLSPSLDVFSLSTMMISEPSVLSSATFLDSEAPALSLTAAITTNDDALTAAPSSSVSTDALLSVAMPTEIRSTDAPPGAANQPASQEGDLTSLVVSTALETTLAGSVPSQTSTGSTGPQISTIGAETSSRSSGTPISLLAPAPTISESAVCPESDGSIYNATDGSQYTVLCDQEYDTQRMMTVDSPTLDDCINQCAGQTQCMGTTYSIVHGTCQVSSSMSSSNTRSSARMASVLRVRAPAAAQASVQTVDNPTFTNGTLSPWVAAGASDGTNFAPVNNTASVSFNFSQPADPNAYNGATPQATVWLRQWINVTTGYSYFISMNVNLTSGGDNACQIGMMSGVQSLVSYGFPAGQSYYGSINGSGIITNENTDYAMIYASCSGNFDATISVFDIVWNAWPPVSASSNSDGGVNSGSSVNVGSAVTAPGQAPGLTTAIDSAPNSALTLATPTTALPTVAIGDIPLSISSTAPSTSISDTPSTLTANSGGATDSLPSAFGLDSPSVIVPSLTLVTGPISPTNVASTGDATAFSYTTLLAASNSEVPSSSVANSVTLSTISSNAPLPTASFEAGGQTNLEDTSTGPAILSSQSGMVGSGTPTASSRLGQQTLPGTSLVNTPTSASPTISLSTGSSLPTDSPPAVLSTPSITTPATVLSSSAALVVSSSVSVLTPSPVSIAAPTSTLCPGYSNCTYTGRDGSTYLIVTTQAYESLTIPGIPAFVAVSLAVCIDFCTLQGSQCQGVSWRPDTQQCRLKANMIPTSNVTYPSVGAIRMTSSLAISAEVLVNGAFEAGMASWTTFTTGITDAVVRLLNLVLGILNGGVGCLIRLSGLGGLLNTLLSPLELVLVQTVNVAAGYSFFLQADLIIVNANLNTDASCWIFFRSENEVLWSGLYNRTSTASTIFGSGTLAAAATRFQAVAQCNGTTDLTVTFDNLSWKTYPRAIGTSPINLRPVATLANSVFDTALGTVNSAWRIAAGTTSNIAVTIAGGLAQMTWNTISTTASIATLLQDLTVGAQANQNFALTALVTVTIPPGLLGGLALCSAGIYLNESLWASGALAATQTFNVNVRGTLQNDATQLSLWAQCTGSRPPRVTWDNVYLTLNPA